MSPSASPSSPRRPRDLQLFVDAAEAAYAKAAVDEPSGACLHRLFSALRTPAPSGVRPGRRLPVCVHLDRALRIDTPDRGLLALVDRFRAIEPLIEWSFRPVYGDTHSGNFAEGHANALIFGPGGFEDRRDLWLGATLMAPQVRYPDHDHSPEEVYLVLTKGEFRQDKAEWFSPGVGGSFYNRPGITHAMRSLDEPFLAFWALWVGT